MDGGAVRGKLERVAVAARNEHGTAALFFLWGSGGEKIIRLEARRFCILEAACGGRDETIWSRSTMACDMAQWSALHAPVLITDEQRAVYIGDNSNPLLELDEPKRAVLMTPRDRRGERCFAIPISMWF